MTARAGHEPRPADPDAVRRAVAERTGSDLDAVQMRETHISSLFITTDRAYKLKKPLVLDFLDYGTAERRRLMCAEEVSLNVRLAPDVYLAVRSLVPFQDGLRLGDEGDPAAIDYVVEMQRYDEDQTLASTVGRRDADEAAVGAVGLRLARFHAVCAPVPRDHGALAVLAGVQRNLRELIAQLDASTDRDRAFSLGGFLEAFVSSRAGVLDERAVGGRVRDCHGDLRAEHVVLRPQLSIVDCVEFDPSLRTLDVADDLAFLVMDLTRLGAPSLAASMVAAYREAGGDHGDDALLAFFAVHRALIRTKVQFVRAAQHPPDSGVRTRAVANGHAFLALAERFAWRARGPGVLVICGVPACGKSYLARALGEASGFAVLTADVVRKELAGLGPHERAPAEVYRPEFNRRTYAELGERAAALARRNGGVLVDATFRLREDRDAFARAAAGALPTAFVECVVGVEVLAARAADRDRDPARISDATAEIVERERRTWAPLDEVPADAHMVVRTDRPVRAVLADLTALLDARLSAATPGTTVGTGRRPSTTGANT